MAATIKTVEPEWPLSNSQQSSPSRRSSVYSTVSNRARGWQSRLGEFMEGRMPQSTNVNVLRWDGASRSSTKWDGLKRDLDLWFPNGNCLVHLYRKGQSRNGPTFRLPFADLMAARCYPLIRRYMAWDGVLVPNPGLGPEYLSQWSKRHPKSRVELYIPPPRHSSSNEGIQFHLAMRNFFAWVCRRSMVGEVLGTALISVMGKMEEFRDPGENHVDDLITYMDEEGYLDMRDQPSYALAVLHLAEYYQLRELYIDAFTHCAGMNDQLFTLSEYQIISSITRKLMRRAKMEMDLKLGRAGRMLSTFLEADLSETHIGLTDGGRSHMERFRSFLHGFYTNKLGYYPPESTDLRSLIFDPEVYRVMRVDFEALYAYLVDTGFTISGDSPFFAQGGICALQSVHSFDLRNKLAPLPHPLPLLPESSTPTRSRRLSWLSKVDKLSPDRRLVTHAALVKATNHTDLAVMNNELVVAYRRFEEDTVCSPHKADRQEKLSLVDARKIRWILIYAIYQVLRSCTGAPAECTGTEDVRYHTAISTASLPPWKEGHHRHSRRWDGAALPHLMSSSVSLPATPSVSTPAVHKSAGSTSSGYEIKPDIDYFALTHQPEEAKRPWTATTTANPAIRSATMKERTRGLPKSTGPPVRLRSLQGSIRRSLSAFRQSQYGLPDPIPPLTLPIRRLSYHEIVVHGYGNGTNDVQVDPTKAAVSTLDAPAPVDNSAVALANRSHSTSSTSSSNSTATSKSAASSVSTAPSDHGSIPACSTGGAAPPGTLIMAMEQSPARELPPIPRRELPQTPKRSLPQTPLTGSPRRRGSIVSARSSVYSSNYNSEDEGDFDDPPALPRRSSMRRHRSSMTPGPLKIRKAWDSLVETEEAESLPSSSKPEIALTCYEEISAANPHRASVTSQDVVDVWDQFDNVGGLTVPVAGTSSGWWSPN